MNDMFLRALLKQPTETTPVWIMRQAGRYLPEYNETRRRAGSFLGLCKNPEYACEVTLQPLDRFDLDASIIFSDILTVPDAMGLGLHFVDGEGPKLANPIKDENDVNKLFVPDVEQELKYVMDAITMTRRAINGRVPLIGFSGSPWTLACYMIEGGGSDDYAKVKSMMYSRPDLMHKILNITADAVTEYLNAQIIAGAQAVIIFDSWGGVLSHDAYKKFSLSYMRQIVQGLIKTKDGVVIPSIAFSKGGGLWLEDQADIGVNALGLDWAIDLSRARSLVGDRVTLQGNMDPVVLRSTPEAVARETERVVRSFGPGNTGHVFNLGHGISQFTPPENVSVLIDTVHRVGREMRVAESQQLTLGL